MNNFLLIFSLVYSVRCLQSFDIPIVINTWAFVHANKEAWIELSSRNHSALDAVEVGCTTCERDQCDLTVGYGGSPDENGETTLDAMIMDGKTMNVGAVGAMRGVKNAISVARMVLEHTKHSFLAGELATNFAVQMGFTKESLSTNVSKGIWKTWRDNHCQPNFWTNVIPDPSVSCGPYRPVKLNFFKCDKCRKNLINQFNHDTIGMIAIDRSGDIAAGTSTNGARHKIAGRVGDSPMIGSGAYAENNIGGAAATGDGDIMMRFLPSFRAVECLRNGGTPQHCADMSLESIVRYYPMFSGGVVVVSAGGTFAASCYGLPNFPFTVSHGNQSGVVHHVNCITKRDPLAM